MNPAGPPVSPAVPASRVTTESGCVLCKIDLILNKEFQRRLMSYQDEWTAWWDPRYTSFFQGRLPVPAELLFAWDDSPRR